MKDEPISPQDSQMTRWIDALPDAPLPEGINIDEASRERAAAAAVATLLRQHVPLRQDPPYPDFFNAQVLKKIRNQKTWYALLFLLWGRMGHRSGGPWNRSRSWRNPKVNLK